MCPSSWKLYVDDFPFFGFPSSLSRTRARAVWSLGDKRATNHHHHQWHQLPNSKTSKSSSSGSRWAREELKKRKIIYIQFPRWWAHCQAIFEGLGCLNSRKAPRENCGNRYLRYLVHLSCSSVFLSKIPVNAAFQKPGNIVRFSRHGPVNWQIRASSTRGGHSRRVQGSRPVWEVVVVPCALVDLSCADHSRVDCWWAETLELVEASWGTLVC